MRWCLAPLVLALAACASPGADKPRAGARAAGLEAADRSMDREVYADLIRSMLDQEQYYAALAHVEQRRAVGGGDGEELRYFEAEARRGLGQTATANALYQGLLKTRLAGQAYHGLGLLYGGTDLPRATGYLQEAAKRLPADSNVRNDFGYALMRAGRLPSAMHELSTAVELAPESEKARNNLLLLMMLQGDEAAVRRITAAAAVPPATVTRLRQQVQAIRAPLTGRGGVK